MDIDRQQRQSPSEAETPTVKRNPFDIERPESFAKTNVTYPANSGSVNRTNPTFGVSEKSDVFLLGPTSSSTARTGETHDVDEFVIHRNNDTTLFSHESSSPSHSIHHNNVDDHNVSHQDNKESHLSSLQEEEEVRSNIESTIDVSTSNFLQGADPRLGIDFSSSHTYPANQTQLVNTLSTHEQTEYATSNPVQNQDLAENNILLSETGMGHTNMDPWRRPDASLKVETSSDSGTARSTAERKEHDDDGHSAASTATTTMDSPSLQPLHNEATVDTDRVVAGGRAISSAFGTPSTVSTSADDTSVEGFDPSTVERLSIKMDEENTKEMIQPRETVLNHNTESNDGQSHQRSISLDPGIHKTGTSHRGQSQWGQQQPHGGLHSFGQGSHGRHVEAWGGMEQTRVASFRPDHYSYSKVPPHSDPWRQQRRYSDHQFYNQLPPSGQFHSTKQTGPPLSPPRSRQGRPGQRQVGQGTAANAGMPGPANPPRSSSEVLKTLLRKKACLYEPGTSRAVALVTWLVGRELALEYGYFSRQQLQSGVHACVASKINSGTITRTKVNRCMQIILNSCFHYIIPRPDGSEENGDSFRNHFMESAQDDRSLLKDLPEPWNNVIVETRTIVQASRSEEEIKKTNSPQSSPRLASVDHPGSEDSKRAVLLCFNENVRSALDVFHCHNEFIRDTANASKLQLTANEWSSFFGRDLSNPNSFDSRCNEGPLLSRGQDFLGRMNEAELATFRTSWCSKRYDHDHNLCGFSHIEVGGGWLRRNPNHHKYAAEMCRNIVPVKDENSGATILVINQCSAGENCPFAHSAEEILYHPSNYKKSTCKASVQSLGCLLGDVCPYLHPLDSHHHIKKPSGEFRSSHHRHPNGRGATNTQGRGSVGNQPPGAPMIYVAPAPFSMFEKQLQMPGLQSIFRRHSSVAYAHLKNDARRCVYTNFGDDYLMYGRTRQSQPAEGVTRTANS
eukprot:CAMPEP_0178928028 /NCGR_PEP_ID=MMETSP0786-20121207/19601_1 /TAXON_ID=186022 /ORGANISM="Thalassionema frauenfeldii, Strain CCMP 1798" /LENGTH=961 /DNA_ID=CAMNT_0020603697 /DNA_START=763 /DNA_END=3648 /DNA_ORIENTATION=-